MLFTSFASLCSVSSQNHSLFSDDSLTARGDLHRLVCHIIVILYYNLFVYCTSDTHVIVLQALPLFQ